MPSRSRIPSVAAAIACALLLPTPPLRAEEATFVFSPLALPLELVPIQWSLPKSLLLPPRRLQLDPPVQTQEGPKPETTPGPVGVLQELPIFQKAAASGDTASLAFSHQAKKGRVKGSLYGGLSAQGASTPAAGDEDDAGNLTAGGSSLIGRAVVGAKGTLYVLGTPEKSDCTGKLTASGVASSKASLVGDGKGDYNLVLQAGPAMTCMLASQIKLTWMPGLRASGNDTLTGTSSGMVTQAQFSNLILMDFAHKMILASELTRAISERQPGDKVGSLTLNVSFPVKFVKFGVQSELAKVAPKVKKDDEGILENTVLNVQGTAAVAW